MNSLPSIGTRIFEKPALRTSVDGLARTRPDQLSFASNGAGSPGHLAGELFKAMTSTRITHVPYKGSAPATLALASGARAD